MRHIAGFRKKRNICGVVSGVDQHIHRKERLMSEENRKAIRISVRNLVEFVLRSGISTTAVPERQKDAMLAEEGSTGRSRSGWDPATGRRSP